MARPSCLVQRPQPRRRRPKSFGREVPSPARHEVPSSGRGIGPGRYIREQRHDRRLRVPRLAGRSRLNTMRQRPPRRLRTEARTRRQDACTKGLTPEGPLQKPGFLTRGLGPGDARPSSQRDPKTERWERLGCDERAERLVERLALRAKIKGLRSAWVESGDLRTRGRVAPGPRPPRLISGRGQQAARLR